jgi:hypothetical protein
MTRQCHLDTEGFSLVVSLQAPIVEDWVDGRIELRLHPELGNLVIQSAPTSFQERDLRGLIEYLEGHITQLQQEPETAASVFVPLELGFQLQALSGDVESDDEGEFTIQVLANVGQREECSRTYVGAKGVVTVASVRAFLSALEQSLATLTSRQ